MEYKKWRREIFDHPQNICPATLELSTDFYSVPPTQAFDFVDSLLVDPEVHSLFSKQQLGNGINMIYSNSCSDLPFLYTTECDEKRRIKGIENLENLYKNFFDRYCTGTVGNIGNEQNDGAMGVICYMFWDVFVLYSGNATPGMISAAIKVMKSALNSNNDNTLVSAIHGLGHWALDVPESVSILKKWLQKPTTTNKKVLTYAHTAMTGMIQ